MATFLMAGGGTGGHVMPGLAVARELRERGHNARFIGTERGMEAKLAPAAQFPIDWIQIGGLKRVGLKQTLATLGALPFSLWDAARLLDRHKPSAVFSTGGYVAGPVLLAALWKRIPVVVMEPNAVPGFTHRRLARYVAKALVSFEETARWFPSGRTEVTGMPIRQEFFDLPAKPREQKLTVLITGGSQGSRRLNLAAEASWPLWNPGEVQFIHQAGKFSYDEFRPKFEAAGVEGEIVPFFDNMPCAFSRADLIVSRSGMSTVSEIAASGKPSILVPLPTASDQHQLRNAEAMAAAGASRLVLDAEMTGERLVKEVRELAASPSALENMGSAARKFARPGAAWRAAEILESFAKKRD